MILDYQFELRLYIQKTIIIVKVKETVNWLTNNIGKLKNLTCVKTKKLDNIYPYFFP